MRKLKVHFSCYTPVEFCEYMESLQRKHGYKSVSQVANKALEYALHNAHEWVIDQKPMRETLGGME